jgi:hypothetical protein
MAPIALTVRRSSELCNALLNISRDGVSHGDLL